jgi:RHS repeat-associated protein
MKTLRRRIAAALTAVLAATLLTAVAVPDGALAAGGPSQPLPDTPSTPVTQQEMTARNQDQASRNALTGNQQPGSTPKKAGGGTPTATALSPSASWQVSPQTGDFTWSYPLRVPPAPGGLEPDLALSYASSAVDGRTSATNNQASWVGDGWDLSPGFVERAYGACAEDDMGGTTPPKVGDLCWRSDNATASYNGGGGELICCDGAGRWRARSDDGARIERLTGAGNGDDNGEYWKITTIDGTQYFYGSRPEAGSTWTVPVFGDDAGEPCHGATFDSSHCVQAWRWNLDKVVDRNGNTIVYGYEPETNSYGMNLKDAAVSYVRGGTLRTIEYGLRDGHAASGRVEFTVADRCVPGSDCVATQPLNWPDVPWDEKCDTATCKDKHSPTFWSTKRLSKITTQVRRPAGFADVDSWTLDQQFPKTGDGEDPTLWLKGIVHTGHVGGTAAMPPLTFEGSLLPNRVFKIDGLSPLNRYRVTGVISETGGYLSVKYAGAECVAGGTMPADAHSNTLRCFPVRWAKDNQPERTDYFHKYVVESTVQSDRISANTQQVTAYEYVGGAAWHYDTSEFTKADKKTWDEFRGYATVRIRTGTANDPAGPIGKTEQRFYRGMHGDKQPSGNRTVAVQPSEGPARVDEDWLRGLPLETITYDGDTDRVVGKSIQTPTWGEPTATRGDRKAYIVRTGATESWTALSGGGWRTTRTESTYDDRGLIEKVNDLGDKADGTDDRCTRTWYARNTDRWLIAFPARVETVAAGCGETPSFPDDAISDVRTGYDGQQPGAAPTHGNITRGDELKARPASGPEYLTTTTSRYDPHGRAVEIADALGRVTTTSFTPEVGGPVTQSVMTNPLGHAVTRTLEPAWGLTVAEVDANRRRTETAYDPLGRTVEVWLPNRERASQGGNATFTYLIRGDRPSVVTTNRLNPNGRYTTTKELYDGLLRLRQTQAPAVGGGRLLTDTRYDSQGRAYKSTQPYFNDAALDDELWVASDVEVAGLTVTRFDGAGRAVAQIYQAGAQERWRTTTAYGGDRVHVTPPAGGTATTAISDAHGRAVEVRQYRGGAPSGAYDATTYTYTKAGQRASTKDPAGNEWRFHYNLRGHQVRVEDPDKGTSTMTYDASGRPLTATDARGVTLDYTYDGLGRMRTVASGGTKLAEWTYDTATKGKGQLASSTRYVDGAAFTRTIASYTALYHAYETRVTIPESPRTQTLAGTYTTYSTLNDDGSPYLTTLPAIGDLPKETMHQEYGDLSNPLRLSGGLDQGGTVEYVTGTEYTRYGEVARVQLGETGKRVWLSYYYEDSTRRLSRSIVDAEVSQPMQSDVNYSYDPAGNILSVADTPKDLPHDVQCFRYDHLRRLTDAWTPASQCASAPDTATLAGAAPYRHSYTYDTVGNRLTETQHAAAGDTVRTYAYPAAGAHQLASVTTTGPSGPSGVRKDEFTYDAAGNTLTRPGQKLDWDAEGKLAAVTAGDKTSRFVYDADGERLLREDPASITAYFDGQELRLDKATGKLTGTRYYQHGGLTVAVRTGAGVTWQAGDHQETAQVAVDAASQQVTKRRQAPFGAPRGAPVPWVGDKGFVGGTTDASTGLTHLGARQYDPLLGRFVSVDPIMDTSDAQQMHGYTYSNNNPVTFADPTGMLFGWIKKAASAVANAVVNTVKEAINHPLDFIANVAVGVAIGALVAGACAVTVGVGCAVAGVIIGGAASGMVGASQNANRQGRAATPGELATGAGVGAAVGGVLHGAGAAIGKVVQKARGGSGSGSSAAAPAFATRTYAQNRGLEKAAAARDAEMDRWYNESGPNWPTEREKNRTFTAGIDPNNPDRIAVGISSGEHGCAECMVAEKLNLSTDQVLFTHAYGYRRTYPEKDGAKYGIDPREGGGVIDAWMKREIPICVKCQGRSTKEQYPRDVKFEPGGAWSQTYTTRDGRVCNRGGGLCAI